MQVSTTAVAAFGVRDAVGDPGKRLRLRDAELVEEEAGRGARRETLLPLDCRLAADNAVV
jgi:hypothetical protein